MRRTRRLTRAQSKYGCLTCKSRKVRCDETRPNCRRCTNSGFVCEGYANTRPESPAQDSSGSSQSWATTNLGPSQSVIPADDAGVPVQQRLARIFQSSTFTYVGQGSLEDVIKSTNTLAPSARDALAALEILVQRDSGEDAGDAESRMRVDMSYGQAIRLFLDEIQRNPTDSNAIFITGIVLVAIELLQRRRQDAWKHLIGLRQSLRIESSFGTRSVEIDFLYRIYDLQTMIYSDGVRSSMLLSSGPSTFSGFQVSTVPFSQLEPLVVDVLHNAYTLTSRLHYAEVVGRLPEEVQDEEQMCYGETLRAVHLIDHHLNNEVLESYQESVCLILRNLCLKTMMEMKQLRSVDEMSWDQYADEFQSIIENAEIFLSRTRTPSEPSVTRQSFPLTLQIGIIAPLVLTGLKYRNPSWRRRAIVCLRQAGIEGPFIGKQLAAMVERCMEIEELGSEQQDQLTVSELPQEITERDVQLPAEDRRLTYCWTDDENGNADRTSWPGTAKGTTMISLVARKRPVRALLAKVLTSSYFRTGDEYQAVQTQSLDSDTWTVWTETIEFNGPSEQL